MIVGGGIAGTFLAAECCRRGHQVTLYHDDAPGTASAVAAGLFNVITGRFAAKSWQAEKFLDALKAFVKRDEWSEIERHFHFTPIYRPFKTAGDKNDWMAKSADQHYDHLAQPVDQPINPDQIINEWGGVMITAAGWCDVPELLGDLQAILERNFQLTKETNFQYEDLQSVDFDHLIFTQGAFGKDNPYWPDTQLQPLKGQIAKVQIPNFDPGFVISKGIYIIPIGNEQFIVGATYERNYDDVHANQLGEADITQSLNNAIRLPFTILEMKAGIRPTTPDRRPYLGTSRKADNVHFFNGLGTKGILQGPYFADLMARYIDGETTIPGEVELHRFLKENS